jgi:hypothetical protein
MARGIRDWTAAIADGSVHFYGDPALVRDLPGWFLPIDAAAPATASPAAVAVA